MSFLHQKGGTGKSTLAVGAAIHLAAQGERVLLIDADYQGTTGEWGNRHGHRFGVETRSQVQPVLHEQRGRFQGFSRIIIDGPPSLSPMTESVLAASDTVIIPCRPSLPDVWAMAWLGAMIKKRLRGGDAFKARVVFNQYGGEDLPPLRKEIGKWDLPVHTNPIPLRAEFAEIFQGKALPETLAEETFAWLSQEL